MESIITTKHFRTWTGQMVDLFDPDPETICIEDIAHSLSNQCRFGGHTPKFYSVAQHSVLCSIIVQEEHQLAALMHDASEAYLIDVPRPLKKALVNYHDMENRMMKVISDKYGFQFPLQPPVIKADENMLQHEWCSFMSSGSNRNIIVFDFWSPEHSKREFLNFFNGLMLAIRCKG
jgi:uncharacterized protein